MNSLLHRSGEPPGPSAPENLNSLLEPIRQKYDLPALAGAIVTSRGLFAVGAVGVRKYGTTTPVTVDDQFHLGSDTKAMTATMLATLVEEGKITWGTTIADVFPEFAGKMNPAYRTVTLDQLLAHRAGFTDASWPVGKSLRDMYRLPGDPHEQRLAYVSMVLSEAPVSTPGTAFLYSNRSYAVAGAMAEKVANDSWESLMQKRLFDPLGMSTCGFGAMGSYDGTNAALIDQPWQHIVVGNTHNPIAPGPEADNAPVIGPAGTVHCSIVDWGEFVAAHLRGEKGEAGILKPDTFKRLHTAPFGGDYAYGWLVVNRGWAGGRAFNHAGSNTQNYAIVWMAPLKDFAALIMTNQAGGDTFKACDDSAATLIGYFSKQKR
ncbi:MAG: serine hydrolase domain-containing protein [Candidatus Sulfotelmatobacter sp.]